VDLTSCNYTTFSWCRTKKNSVSGRGRGKLIILIINPGKISVTKTYAAIEKNFTMILSTV
jgi:hypothetical protein